MSRIVLTLKGSGLTFRKNCSLYYLIASVWEHEKYLRPLPELYFNDYDNIAVNSGIKKRGTDEHYEAGQPVTDFQKWLFDLKAYSGKIDGWLGDITKSAIALFQNCSELGGFVDKEGNKAEISEDDILRGERKGTGSVFTQEAAKKFAGKGVTVKKKGCESVGINGKMNEKPCWLEFAENEAKRWAGKTEIEITKKINYNL